MATFADKPTITGEHVVLRPLGPEDTDELLASLEDAETRRLTGTQEVFTREEIGYWCASRADQRDRLDLSVVERETGRWAGECAVNDWNPRHRSCNLRISLAPGFTDRGLGTEALRLVIDYVFGHLPIDRVGLDVYDFNARAIHVFERLGFAREGSLKGVLRTGDTRHDVVIMGLLRYEWDTRTHPSPPAEVTLASPAPLHAGASGAAS